MRSSRIPHPPAARLIKIWRWAVEAVGFDAAIVLGELEWRDRVHDRAEEPLLSRQRLLAELENFLSAKRVDKALQKLTEIQWVMKIQRSTVGEKNLQHWFEYALNVTAITAYLQTSPGDADQISPALPIGNAGDFRSGDETATSTNVDRALSLSLNDSHTKEREDREFAVRLGKSCNLSDVEIDAVLSACRYPSEMPRAMQNATRRAARKPQRVEREAQSAAALRASALRGRTFAGRGRTVVFKDDGALIDDDYVVKYDSEKLIAIFRDIDESRLVQQ